MRIESMKKWTKMYGRRDQLVVLLNGKPVNADVKRVSALINGTLMKGSIKIGKSSIQVESKDGGNLWEQAVKNY